MKVKNFQRRWLCVLLAIMMMTGSVVGCGSKGEDSGTSIKSDQGEAATDHAGETGGGSIEKKDEKDDASSDAADKENEASESGEEKTADEITIQEQVLFEQDGIKVTAKELTEGSLWGPEVKVLVENTTDTGVTVQVKSMSVNGLMVTPMFSCEVAAQKSANDSITIMESELEAAGISRIQNLEFTFHVYNSESWEGIFDTEQVYLATSIDGTEEQAVDNTGQLVLEQDGVSITVKETDSESSFWGTEIYVYIENNSDQNITVQTRSVSINGIMVSPLFSCEVAAGKKAFDTITFLESDLTENGIESIDNMGVSFHIFNTDNWEAIFDSEEIAVEFSE